MLLWNFLCNLINILSCIISITVPHGYLKDMWSGSSPAVVVLDGYLKDVWSGSSPAVVVLDGYLKDV